jgi:hypothetical protein
VAEALQGPENVSETFVARRSINMRNVLAAVCLVVLLAVSLPAQDYRARVMGTVMDSTQAAIPGATVTLRNVKTGIEVTRETDPVGNYRFDFVEPGSYTLTVQAPGFNRFVQENITVLTRGDVTVNATLSVGEVTESITVEAAPVEVKFNTTTMAQTITSRLLADLPVLARNPFTLVLLNPAVINRYWDIAHRNPYYMQSSNGVDVGGNTGGRNDLLLDGTPIGVDSRGSYAPPMDAVQEVAVEQNSMDAEFGFSAGGTMSVSMKSGTNELHGTAYYFGRNPAVNALANRYTRSEQIVRKHVVGGTAGGPIIKNKLFTYGVYEYMRDIQPREGTRTLPTDLERMGDFSQSKNILGGMRVIYDPWTTKFNQAANTATRDPFPGNIIPASRLDPTARIFMNDVWRPNGPGDDITGTNNFKLTYPWWNFYHNFSNRTDWHVSDKLRVFGRYSFFRTRLDNENYANSPAVPSDNGGLMDARNAAGDAVWTLSPTTVVNVRGSYSGLEDDYNSEWAKVGEAGLRKLWGNNTWYQSYLAGVPAIYYPHMNVSGKGSFGKSSTWFYRPRKWGIQGNVTKTIDRHTLKYGAAYRYSWGTSVNPNLMRWDFDPSTTANTFISPDTRRYGDSWASVLLGVINPSSYAQYKTPQNIIRKQYGVFFQDDFRLSRRVTLNLGLRYEYETAPIEEFDRMSRYLDLTNPIPEFQANAPQMPAQVTAIRKSAPIYNGAWVFTDPSNRRLYKAPRDLILPRLGVALRVNDKTALRIGWGRYAVPMVNAIGSSWYIPADGFNAITNTLPLVEGIPQTVLSDPFPAAVNPLIQPAQKSRGRYENLGAGATWFLQDMKVGVNDRINVSLQRELPNRIVTDITYFVNIGHNAPVANIWGNGGQDFNVNLIDPQLVYQYKAAVDARVSNPFYNILTPQKFPGTLRNQATIAVRQLLRPYPQYGDLIVDFKDGFRDRYQALQLRAERAFSGGYTFTAAYNYHRQRSDVYFNADDQYLDRKTLMPSSDPRHRISFGGVWEFPLGKGRRFGASMHPVLDAVIGGWSTSHLFMWNSGAFLRFGQMEVSGNPILDHPTRDKWFKTEVFAIATPYTPRTNPWQYEGLTGPGFWSWDGTLAKFFQLTERFRMELRLEAYNVPNSFMPAAPSTSVTSPTFGKSVGPAAGNYGREVQYSLRLHF